MEKLVKMAVDAITANRNSNARVDDVTARGNLIFWLSWQKETIKYAKASGISEKEIAKMAVDAAFEKVDNE